MFDIVIIPFLMLSELYLRFWHTTTLQCHNYGNNPSPYSC